MYFSYLFASCLAANTISAAVLPTRSAPEGLGPWVPFNHSLVTALPTATPFFITTITSVTTTSTTTTISAAKTLINGASSGFPRSYFCWIHPHAPQCLDASSSAETATPTTTANVTTTPSFPIMPLKFSTTLSTRKHESMATDAQPVAAAVYPVLARAPEESIIPIPAPKTTYRWPPILCDPKMSKLAPGFYCRKDPAKSYFEVGWSPGEIWEGKEVCCCDLYSKLPPTWLCVIPPEGKPTLERGVEVPVDCSTHEHPWPEDCKYPGHRWEPMDDNGVLWDMLPTA